MRLAKPRVQPIQDEDYSAELREATGLDAAAQSFNVIRTLAHAPLAMTAFLTWARYIMSPDNSLPSRERELVTLRVGHLCRCGYEIAQHVRIGLAAGLTPDEIDRIERGADAGWSDADAALIRACDDLISDHFVSDDVWQALLTSFTERQAIDVVMTVGQYAQVAMMLNSFGVQIEPDSANRTAWKPYGGFDPKAS